MGIQISGLKLGDQNYDGTWSYGPNSAGGVGICMNFQNTGSKTIKYITFAFVPYNAVGDAVGCTIRNESEFRGKCTGPIAPNSWKNGVLWENAWYNYSIKSAKITRAYVQYMDGSEETIQGSEITMATGGSASGCCYVATAVYDSYNCPEVWTLRRYRDYKLAETWYGRAFVRLYYAVSPSLVRKFGKTEWFKKMWRGRLDKMVKKLQAEGYESTPYEDKVW